MTKFCSSLTKSHAKFQKADKSEIKNDAVMTTAPQVELNDRSKINPEVDKIDKYVKTPNYQPTSMAESQRRNTYQVSNSHLKQIYEAPDEDLSSKQPEDGASNFSKTKSIGFSIKKLTSEKPENAQSPLEKASRVESNSNQNKSEDEWADSDEDTSKAKGETQILPKCTPIMSKN